MRKQLPKNWVECKIEDIADVTSGIGFPIHYQGNFDDSQIPFYKVGDISQTFLRNEVYLNNANNYVSDEVRRELNGKLLQKGTLVFAKIGEALRLNRRAIISRPSLCDNNVMGIIPHSSDMHKFIYYYFNTQDLGEFSAGNSVPSIRKSSVLEIVFPLPPLSEQNRIVATLDVLFAHLEEIKTKIRHLNGISDRFTYSCLVDSKKNKFHPREKIGQFLEERTERIGDNWNGLRLIGVSTKEGITDLRIGQKESFEKYKIVKSGDFIYNTMRVNIGSIAIYKGSETALTSPDYVVFRVSNYLSSQLLFNFLKSDQGLLEIGANTKGSVRARLYFKALSEIRMPIAPIEIQNLAENFLQGFNNNLNTINALKKAKLDKLSRSILVKAFKGELVEQLDSDGDARELLKEIKKLKNHTILKKKKV